MYKFQTKLVIRIPLPQFLPVRILETDGVGVTSTVPYQ